MMNAFMATEVDFEVQYWWMITFSIPVTTFFAFRNQILDESQIFGLEYLIYLVDA